MDRDKENWIERVLDSMEDAQRATPEPGLFSRITKQIEMEGAKVIPMAYWRITAVVAGLLLIFNVLAISFYNSSHQVGEENARRDTYNSINLISNYDIYEE